MGALQRAMLPPPATGRPGARGATVATTGAATDEQPAKAPSAKLGRKEIQCDMRGPYAGGCKSVQDLTALRCLPGCQPQPAHADVSLSVLRYTL